MKRKWMYVYAFEHIALQNYLNEMKEKGLQVCKLSNHYIGFEKKEKKGHYQVVVSGKREDDPNRMGEEALKQQNLMVEFGYEHVCSFGYFHVYYHDKKHIPPYDEAQELLHIQDVTNKYKESFTSVLIIAGLLVIIGSLLLSKIDFYYLLEMIANRKVHLLLLYWILAILTAYRMESPLRAFKKNPQLIKESEAIQKRGLSIFIMYFLVGLFIYYIPAMIVCLVSMLVLMKLLRKYAKGYLIAVGISGVLFSLSNNIISELMNQSNRNEVMIYDVQFDQRIENESLWLKSIRYEKEDLTILEVELKDTKFKGIIEKIIEGYYGDIKQDCIYVKGNYVVEKADDHYVFVETIEDDQWIKKLK